MGCTRTAGVGEGSSHLLRLEPGGRREHPLGLLALCLTITAYAQPLPLPTVHRDEDELLVLVKPGRLTLSLLQIQHNTTGPWEDHLQPLELDPPFVTYTSSSCCPLQTTPDASSAKARAKRGRAREWKPTKMTLSVAQADKVCFYFPSRPSKDLSRATWSPASPACLPWLVLSRTCSFQSLLRSLLLLASLRVAWFDLHWSSLPQIRPLLSLSLSPICNSVFLFFFPRPPL